MRLYHQCGHNFVWNIESLTEEGVGDGLIVSPVNIESDKIADRLSEDIRAASWFDPQFYLPHDSKGKLETYPFFPANYLEEFETDAYDEVAHEVASECLKFQDSLGFGYLVIPTRYRTELPEDHLEQLQEFFVNPFLEEKQRLASEKPLLLTVIARPIQIAEGPARDELLSWITGYPEITGVYLIFDNDFQSKQIQDPEYLANAMSFIHILRENDMEVHVGYCGLEGLLYSIADATSVSVGAYENLRRFDIKRLKTDDRDQKRSPTPRIYSGRLLQWISENSMPAIRKLVKEWEDLFDESPYIDYLLRPPKDEELHFQKPQIYKHYFSVFSRQVSEVSSFVNRGPLLKQRAQEAISLFDYIANSNVLLEPDSNGDHLYSWINAISMYEAAHKGNE
jgi:hypothetical protein